MCEGAMNIFKKGTKDSRKAAALGEDAFFFYS